MKLGVLGAGVMTAALVPHWVEAGHEVVVGGRNPEKAMAVARRLGAKAGTLRHAAESGDALMVAVRWEGIAQTLADAGAADGVLHGKPIVDCTNPVEVDQFTLVTPPGRSMAEQIAVETGGLVAKAFNLCEASVWRMRPPAFDGRALVVPVAGDQVAIEVASQLVADVGATALDAGPLSQARHLEAMAAVIIRQLFGGASPYSVFNWITPTHTAA